MSALDLVNEIRELKTQLAYSKNIGFFLGAGTSCALNIPNIEMLTITIESKLTGDAADHFQILKKDLAASIPNVNIEHILNQIRRIREITNDEPGKDFMSISGAAAKTLDKDICDFIYEVISAFEEKADLTIPTKFFAWLNNLNRDFLKEVFTTNYDLIVERSLEASQIPYFDGFVGSYEPFFWQESIDQHAGPTDMTRNWIRLWKIHGSLSWFWKESTRLLEHNRPETLANAGVLPGI